LAASVACERYTDTSGGIAARQGKMARHDSLLADFRITIAIAANPKGDVQGICITAQQENSVTTKRAQE